METALAFSIYAAQVTLLTSSLEEEAEISLAISGLYLTERNTVARHMVLLSSLSLSHGVQGPRFIELRNEGSLIRRAR